MGSMERTAARRFNDSDDDGDSNNDGFIFEHGLDG